MVQCFRVGPTQVVAYFFHKTLTQLLLVIKALVATIDPCLYIEQSAFASFAHIQHTLYRNYVAWQWRIKLVS